jgi:hypothetical protein
MRSSSSDVSIFKVIGEKVADDISTLEMQLQHMSQLCKPRCCNTESMERGLKKKDLDGKCVTNYRDIPKYRDVEGVDFLGRIGGKLALVYSELFDFRIQCGSRNSELRRGSIWPCNLSVALCQSSFDNSPFLIQKSFGQWA